MIVPSTFPVFIGVSPIVPLPAAVTEAALTGPLIVDVHVNVVPPIVDVGRKFKVASLQICFEKSEALLVMTGTGVMETVTSNGSPGHPFDSGVMRYTTVPEDTASALVKTCVMLLPEPAAAPPSSHRWQPARV